MTTLHVHEDHRNLYHKWVICGVRAVTVTSALSSYKHFIHVTPAPVLARLKGLHHGMLGLMKVLGGVFVFGRVAAADMSANEAFPQVNPGIAHLQALLAAFAAGLDLANFLYVRTS
jgi:hypothetical protein